MNKPIRVSHNGKYTQVIYLSGSKWDIFKHKVGLVISLILKIIFIGSIGFLIGASVIQSRRTINIPAIPRNDRLPEKIAEFKNNALLALGKCEDQAFKPGDDGIIMDTNNKISIGQYKFQIKTVQYYYKTLYKQDITKAQAVEIAMDPDKAKQLAHDVLFTTGNGAKEWVNCFKKHDLSRSLQTIKQLEN